MSLVRWRKELMKESSWKWKMNPMGELLHPWEFCTFSCWSGLFIKDRVSPCILVNLGHSCISPRYSGGSIRIVALLPRLILGEWIPPEHLAQGAGRCWKTHGAQTETWKCQSPSLGTYRSRDCWECREFSGMHQQPEPGASSCLGGKPRNYSCFSLGTEVTVATLANSLLFTGFPWPVLLKINSWFPVLILQVTKND